MTKLSDLDFYQSPWLTVADLSGRAARVTISEVAVESVRQRDGSQARKVVLSFAGKRKRLIANHTQAHTAAAAWGDHLERWAGKQCILQPGRAENGKETILLVPLPPAAEAAGPAAPSSPAAAGQAPAQQPEPPADPEAMGEAEVAALWAPATGGKLVDPAWAG